MTKRKIVITLPENPSTGYMWDVQDADEVRVVGNEYAHTSPTHTDDGDLLVGGGGERTFTLECKDAGAHGQVSFRLHQPWDPDTEVQRITMEVQ